MATKQNSPFNLQKFLSKIGNGKSTLKAPKGKVIFLQGDPAEAVFYVQSGKVVLSVVSQEGNQAIVGILEEGAFFGEGTLAGQLVHLATATTLEDATPLRMSKTAMI